MKSFSVSVPVWDTQVDVLFRQPNLASRLEKLNVIEEDIKDALENDYEGITLRTKNSRAVVIVLEPIKDFPYLIGLLSHEMFHAAHHILHESGVSLRDRDANESHAYLIGYLTGEMAKKLMKRRKKS